MSSAAPTSAECVCTSGGRSAGAAVGNHEDAAGSVVARVEILMGDEPKMTSFLVEDLDEVLELSD